MIHALGQLVEIRAGHPFRGSVPPADDGDAQVIQLRDVSSSNGTVAWPSLVKTDLSGSKSPDWLQNEDLLFAARGARNYAIRLADVPPRTVGAQYFFVLRCKEAKVPDVLPAYLAWQINSGPCQRYLANNAEGTDQLSIRRPVLEDMPIALPSLERQRLLVSLAEAAKRERRCLEALIRTREQQLDAIADRLLSPRFQ